MNKLLPTIIVILIVFGFGCFAYRPDGVTPPADVVNPPPRTAVEDLLGVVSGINEQNQTLSLLLPDGGAEDILVSAETVIAPNKGGTLARVTGERDLATRRITARTIEFVDLPNLVVTSPSAGATITSPLLVFGFSRAASASLDWRLRDAGGAIVQSGTLGLNTALLNQYQPFRLEIFLAAVSAPAFTLELSGPRGVDLVSVPLQLLSIEPLTFKVYFPNSSQGSARDCTKVFAVERTLAPTSAVSRAALLELLKGPTSAEKAKGYYSSLLPSLQVNSVVVGDDVVAVDFNQPINWVRTGCGLTSARAQIASTLAEFGSVMAVHLTVGGENLVVLEP
jgi:hypothetical protein